MFDGLSRRNFLALAGAAATMDSTLARRVLGAVLPVDSHPTLPEGVVRGNVRFQVLSPMLVRMEYVPTAHFIDAPSVAVLNRRWPASPFQVHDADGWAEIVTSHMVVKYKLNSGKFTSKNLVVSWTDETGARAWKPEDIDDKNLGGAGEDIRYLPGPLSRNGYFRLDDSDTAVWNAALEWPEPRPNREEAQAWYFFVYGHNYKACLQEMTRLLGPIPMVPRYVFGTWAGSRAGYSADEWQRIVYRFREEEIPLDVVVLDSSSTAAVIWSGFDWDPEQFPDPKGFFAWMKARGVKVTINEHDAPITRESDRHFDQVRKAMGLPETTTEIHNILSDKKYAELYTDVLHKPGLDMGMAFWWQDEVGESNMAGLDATLWLRRIDYEGAERTTGKRALVFCRLAGAGGIPPRGSPEGSAAWGVHRYGLFFTGDLAPYWSTLERLVPLNVRAGNVLAPYVANILACDQAVSLDHELYLRWAQFGSFNPVFWWHGLNGMRMPWEYGEECQAQVKQFLTLRYSLVPYIYTYTRLAYETGAPLVRGTWLEYPEQEQAYKFDHQFLFGQALLVAPITQPGGGKPVRKEIYLPEGEHWFDYFTGQIYSGGQILNYDCPLSRMPLLVKAGSILPLAPEMQSTDDYPIDYLILDIYVGKPATFRLYEDDDTSLDYRKGAYAWTSMQYAPTSTEGEHVITIGPTEGRYQGQPQARWYRVQVHGLFRPERVMVQGRVISEKRQRGNVRVEGWVWHPVERVTVIDLTTPVAGREAVTVTLEQAGVFSDAVAVQTVWAYRERVRRVKLAEKLLWAVFVGSDDLKKQSHVLQETERVEQTLNDLVDHGADLAEHPVDFRGMTAAILDAFITRPFDASRTLPELDPSPAGEMLKIAHVTFTPEERRSMTAELLACDLIASATDSPKLTVGIMSGPLVHAQFVYDTTLIDPPQIVYEITFPDDGPPGWVELSRDVHPDGSAAITVIPPFPPPLGPHTMKVKGIATWGPHQVILERDVVWTVGLAESEEGDRPSPAVMIQPQ